MFAAMRNRLLPCVLGTLLAACGADAPLREAPELRLLDSVIVFDTGSTPLSPPNAIAVTTDGTIYLADARSGVLVVVDRSGRMVQRIGRRGRGPGEWARGPGHPMLLDGDSALLVNDGGWTRRITIPSGMFVADRAPLGGASVIQAVDGDRLFYDAPRQSRRRALQVAEAWADTLRQVGPMPAHWEGRPELQLLFGTVAAWPWRGDSVVVALEGVDSVYVWSLVSDRGRAVPLPATRRRGAKIDLILGLNATDPAALEQAVYQPSQLWALTRVGDGDTVVVLHADVAMVDRRPTAQFYLSLVDVASGQSCTDAPLPLPADPLPVVWLGGRLVFVVTQEDDTGGDVQTIVRRYSIGGENCRWR